MTQLSGRYSVTHDIETLAAWGKSTVYTMAVRLLLKD
jgi:hypothetical protein